MVIFVDELTWATSFSMFEGPELNLWDNAGIFQSLVDDKLVLSVVTDSFSRSRIITSDEQDIKTLLLILAHFSS